MAEPQKEKFLWRLVNLGLGILYVIVAFYVAANPGLAVNVLIILLSVVLLFSGILRIFNAFFEKEKNGTWRIFYLVLGIITVLIGLSVLVFQTLGQDILILMLALGLAMQGLSRIGTGFRSQIPFWLRIIFVLFGVITLFLSFFVIISTDLAILTLTLYLAYGFVLNGIARLIMATTGHNPHKDD